MVALNKTDFFDASQVDESGQLSGLTADQQERLTDLLDRYLVGLENSEPLDVDALLADNHDIAAVFHAYLEHLHALYGIAAGTGPGRPHTGPPIKQLGDFLIVREIGRGGMGIVYEAKQLSLDRPVAIKLLPFAAMLDNLQIARFLNEARAAGLLNHPNIVPVYSVGLEHGVYYYAMQLIDGATVESLIIHKASQSSNTCKSHLHGTLFDETLQIWKDWQATVQMAIDVALALHAAHESGVIHRDIKPSNLIVDKQGKIWITDFGLARCQSDASLTGTGSIVGTLRYMSPEQTTGKSSLVDSRCDIYSLAATLYEMLTLRPVFDGESSSEILKQIESHQIVPLRKLRPDLPRDLETVLAKALSKQRDGRYETAQDFAADLRRASVGEPTIARPPTAMDHALRFALRHRTLAAYAALLVLLGTIGLAVSTATFARLRHNARESANHAQTTELLARGAVHRLGAQIAVLLEDIPEAEAVRRRVLLETLDYYQRFAAKTKDDPRLKSDLATTLGKIGDLQVQLKDIDAAIASLGESERLFHELADESPDDHNIILDWANTQNNLGEALFRAGKSEEAARFYSRAIKSLEKFITKDDDLLVSLSLATAFNNLGILLQQSDANNEARELFMSALELIERVDSGGSVTHTSTEIDLAHTVRVKHAGILQNLGLAIAEESPELALNHVRSSLSMQTQLLEAEPANVKLAADITVTLNQIGSLQSKLGSFAQAIATFDEAIEIGNQLDRRLPNNTFSQNCWIVSWNHKGLTHISQGNFLAARQCFENSLSRARIQLDLFPENLDTISTLASVLNNLGFVHQRLGDRVAAERLFTEAVKLQSTALEMAPDSELVRRSLRKHQQNLDALRNGEKGFET